ncbi:CPBP family intramembrane metalloprotease [Salmonella enterica]|nr:CPBP family intramembrane metalloprotease [Salmonella enterica]
MKKTNSTNNFFSYKKTTNYILFLIPIINILWVGIPYLTTTFMDISLDNSFYIMLTLQLLTAFFSYFLFLKKKAGFKILGKIKTDVAIKLLFCFIFILLIQLTDSFLFNVDDDFEPLLLNPVITLTLLVIVPFYEEIFFRGCLFNGFCSIFKGRMITPSILTSIVFCISHMQYDNIVEQSILFISSLILTYTRVLTNYLFYPMLIHSGMNLVFLTLNYNI